MKVTDHQAQSGILIDLSLKADSLADCLCDLGQISLRYLQLRFPITKWEEFYLFIF